MLLGGVSRVVLQTSPCPVVIVPRSATTREAGIVGDGSEAAGSEAGRPD